jgi:hypothetical protein
MADAERSTIIRALQVLVPIVGLGVAIVSILLAAAARKKELTFVFLGRDKLISLDAGGISSDVKVEYNGKPVMSLTKMRFVIRNTGSSAIKGEDVREPLTLYFSTGTQLLNSAVDRTLPTEFTFQTVADQAARSVTCTFPLLNSGDEAYFSVFALNSTGEIPEVRGRIVDVKEILSEDDSQRQQASPLPFTSSAGTRRVLYWVLFGFNCFAFSLAAGLTGAFAIQFLRIKQWELRWREKLAPDRDEVSPIEGFYYKAELTRRGIPPNPASQYDNWKEFLGGTLVLTVVALLFAGSAVFMFFSPRGY